VVLLSNSNRIKMQSLGYVRRAFPDPSRFINN
jgi:hypothetical protein